MSILDKVNYEPKNYWYRLGNRIAWWDRYQKLWTTYLIDQNGNQKSDAEYAPRKSVFHELERRGLLDEARNDFERRDIKWNKFAYPKGITS